MHDCVMVSMEFIVSIDLFIVYFAEDILYEPQCRRFSF